jgi:hypothetical protein
MRKIDVLCWGVEHIASNHGFGASINYEESGELCIYGGCNVPTLSDVRMLCSDLGIGSENIESSEFGIDIWLTCEWYEEQAEQEYKPTDMEMWKRHDVQIGS